MKYLLSIIGLFAVFASAELPNSVKDKPTDDNLVYLDGKANKAFNITRKFESATSTVTVSGYIDIGIEEVTASAAAPSCSVSCPAGKYILTGGCVVAGGKLVGNYKASITQWYCATDVANCSVLATCARIK